MRIGVFTCSHTSSNQWILSLRDGCVVEHYRHMDSGQWISQNNRPTILKDLKSLKEVAENDTTRELIKKVITDNFEDFL